MDLVTLVTACALAVDPKLMHALVWHQSGGEPWAVSRARRSEPARLSEHAATRSGRRASSFIREHGARRSCRRLRAAIEASRHPFFCHAAMSRWRPCRSASYTSRCKTHPRLKTDPTFCAVAVYRGSWEQPDVKFATDVAASVAKGDAPNFDMPRGTSTEIFDTADDLPSDAGTPVVDITAAFADRARSWSSALFPPKSKASTTNRTTHGARPRAEATERPPSCPRSFQWQEQSARPRAVRASLEQ